MTVGQPTIRMSLPLWSLLLGGVSVHLAGREPSILYFDAVLLLWLVYQVVWNGFFPRCSDWIVTLGAFYLYMGLVSAVVNYEDINRTLAALKVLGVGLLVYAIAKRAQPRLFTLCLWGAVVGLLLLQNYEQVRYGTYEGVAGMKDEIGIAMGRSNYIASILLLLIPLSVASAQLYRGVRRWLSVVCAMLMVAGLVCTMSRGAFLAILFATIVSLPFLIKGGIRATHVGLAFALVIAVIALLPSDLLETNLALFAYRAANPDLAREELMRATWQCFKENPFLGVGPGQLSTAIGRHLVIQFYGTLNANAHNLVLDALAESGMAAGLALLTMVGIVVRRAWKAVRLQPTPLNVAVWIAILAAVSHNMVEGSFEGQQFQVVFWIVAALAGTGSALEWSSLPRIAAVDQASI